MCVPKQPDPAAQPSSIPSMEAASNLNLAAVPRGAAGLGRLALRLPGAVKTASGSASQTTTQSAQSATAPSSTGSSSTGAPTPSTFDPTFWGFSSAPNKDLRIATP